MTDTNINNLGKIFFNVCKKNTKFFMNSIKNANHYNKIDKHNKKTDLYIDFKKAKA